MSTELSHAATSNDEEALGRLLPEIGLVLHRPKNWPHMKFLCTSPSQVKDVLGIIHCEVDVFMCTSEQSAPKKT